MSFTSTPQVPASLSFFIFCIPLFNSRTVISFLLLFFGIGMYLLQRYSDNDFFSNILCLLHVNHNNFYNCTLNFQWFPKLTSIPFKICCHI